MTKTFPAVVALTALAFPSFRSLDAQTRVRERAAERPAPRESEVRIERLPSGMTIALGSSNRAMLGVTLGSRSRSDSAGVSLEEVRADGPAGKAGLKAGDIITEINGVSLRVSASDAADPELEGIGQRRLQRVLAKAKAGDAVELRVLSGGTLRMVKVTTVSAADLEGAPRRWGTFNGERDQRPAVGLSVGASGSIRDTLGLFVSSVVANGPAEGAGIIEGERIAAVNGIDVRIPREDAEDMSAAQARVNRFVREVQKAPAGTTLTMRVFGSGRYRDVSVKSVPSSELPSQGFSFSSGDGGMSFMSPSFPRAPMPPRAPSAARPPSPPMAPDRPDAPRIILRQRSGASPDLFEFDGGNGRVRIDGAEITIDGEAVREAMQEMRQRLQGMGDELRFRFRDDGQGQMFTSPRVRVLPRRTVTIL